MVSVIIPIYNIKDYMADSVRSVMLQTYKDIEIILVDDGSTDESPAICDEYMAKDSRIRVVHKKNGGLSSARNAGIDIAKGDYLIFLDSDDYLALNTIEYISNIQKKTDADIVQYGYIETEQRYHEEYITGSGKYELVTDKKRFYEKLYEIGGEAASACTKLYKRELFDDLRFKEGILHEDEYMITRMLTSVNTIVYITEKLYYYVMRGGSIIHSGFNMKKLDFFLVGEDRIQALKKLEYNELLKQEYERQFSSLMNYYCTAAFRKSEDGCKAILKLIRDFYEKYDYVPIGKMKVFYKLCRINPKAVHIYYMLRKYFGHID